MASRQQQPIIRGLLILGISALLIILRFTSDLHTPLIFLIKAVFMPITVGYLAVVVTVALWYRKRATSIACILSLIALLPFIGPNITLSSSASLSANSTLRIATFSAMTRTQNTVDIKKFIQRYDPDILCLQEIDTGDIHKLVDQLDNHYDYQQTNSANLTIFSHPPISVRSDAAAYQHVVIDAGLLGKIDLFNVHMTRPYRTQAAMDENWKNLLQQIDRETATLLCGDFNFSPYNSLYDSIVYHYGYTDALQIGYGFTYPNAQRRSALFGPLIRIDYLFSKKLTPSRTETLNVSNLSDHRAVMTSYKVPQP
ncbi:MAG: endonuclease/exonuclease/phosphatase family protein [Arenicella sp.]|nr:endonuclease/exonuclease/phosphatase family protein [Arenicella sp.]